MKCNICYKEDNFPKYKVKEMMFGLREEFEYFKCDSCGCLQILEIPSDMAKYYPNAYHSFLLNPENNNNILKKILIKVRNNYAVLNKKGWPGKFLFNLYPRYDLKSVGYIPKLTKATSIIDIGCGSGYALYDLKELGFKNIMGIDPYIDKDILYKNGLKILKKQLSELDTSTDVIMMHHVLEHLEDQHAAFKLVHSRLKEDGIFLVRIPISSSFSREKYRENWVAWDAPRHFFLHTIKSINFLANENSFELERVIYDSDEYQFWASEQYSKDIPLYNKNSHYKFQDNHKSTFTNSEIKEFKKKAQELNEKEQGDAAVFILRKV